MKKKGYTKKQIAFALRQAKADLPALYLWLGVGLGSVVGFVEAD
jgi:hypothetical protein